MNNIKNANKLALIIFALFILLAAALAALAYFLPNAMRISLTYEAPVNKELVNLPKIESSIFSESDGKEHNISVDFTLAVNENVKEEMDTETIQAKIVDTVNNLDYDKINAKGGMDYIKAEVIRSLDGYIPAEDFNGLYIRNINRDGVQIQYSTQPASSSSSTENEKPKINEIFDALRFK
ncbi:hypothetical protein LJB89_03080 [Tyzzerella sp. OttesenSCG-928-J15]|nr:hypothetical protein [Tyzzerella sp. OttesenSCG-928-J15]